MVVRLKNNHNATGTSSEFNIHALSEIIVRFDDDSMDTMFIKEFDVYIQTDAIGWKDMHQAFKDKDIVPNNENTHFKEPSTINERERGWY